VEIAGRRKRGRINRFHLFKLKPISEIAAKAKAEARADSAAALEAVRKPKLPPFTSMLAIAMLVGLLIAAVVGYRAAQAGAVQSGRIAKQMCSCLWVANRDYDSCAAEVAGETKDLRITFGRESVEVNYFGIAHGVAQLEPGYGCHIKAYSGLTARALGQ
jgi:hypothetical protein